MKSLCFRVISIWVLVVMSIHTLQAEVTARVAGLEDNREYISLLEQVEDLNIKEDSLGVELQKNRSLYVEGGGVVDIYRQRVLALEQQIFDIRADKRVVISRVSNIEQSWIIDNMTTTTIERLQPTDEAADSSSSRPQQEDVVRISQSRFLMENLPSVDLQNLESADLEERRIEAVVNSYISNYNELALLKQEYTQTTSESDAASIISRYSEIDSLNKSIMSRIDEQWSEVLDIKSYAYTLLMERLASGDIIAAEEKLRLRALMVIDSLRDRSHDEELLRYYALRLSLVDHEISVAKRLQLSVAVDSLNRVLDSLQGVEFDFPPLSIEERLFIHYEPIKFSTKAVYTASNLIPNGRVYDRGVIYRLLLGSYNSRQAASVFRGAYPLCIIKNNMGLLSYYAGGYETQEEAEAAREMLLKHGFRRPEVVEWRDGELRNLTKEPRLLTLKYRVDIEGVSELSEEVKGVVERLSQGRELLKRGVSTFVVGTFDDKDIASTLVDSLIVVDDRIKATVVTLE